MVYSVVLIRRGVRFWGPQLHADTTKKLSQYIRRNGTLYRSDFVARQLMAFIVDNITPSE